MGVTEEAFHEAGKRLAEAIWLSIEEPRNARDLAGDFAAGILEWLRENKEVKE